MAIYTNVVQEFRGEIEARLSLNDVIDHLISEKVIDDKLYFEIWGNQRDRVSALLDVILKDGKRCRRFIETLGTISHMKTISDAIQATIEKICRVIVIGGFPEFSLNYVVRNSVATEIQRQALDLDPKNSTTLVVFGLAGFGKSCLVNQVLQTKRFLEASGGAMFWINLGEHVDTTTIINPLWNLYLTAVKLTDEAVLSHKPDDIKVLQNEVKRIFLDDHLAKSYIILDDVKSSEVLDVFKLRCKTIVTTQDKNIANDFDASFIKVTTGFTKKESLELLRKSLETDNLCSKETFANKIHELCDGCPLLLNIIGSMLKDSREEALTKDKIWDLIIDEMAENNYLSHPTTTKVIHMIQIFVGRLSPEVQKCFHSLAVFPKHVNIRPEILMKLWDKTYLSVRQIMVELENKSLIVSFYNKDLKTYIYSVHGLVRTYLVKKTENIKKYHEKLISKCEDVTIQSSPDDPIANYIFGYYGYHAKNAELFDKFEKYFDLRFIENKIKRVGSADLLTDFKTYEIYITRNDPRLQRKLKDYIKFVNSYSAHLHLSPETNIIQFAFFNDNNCVYEEAKKIAVNNPDHLYFKLEPYSGVQKNFPTLKTKSTAISTCFIDSKEVLVGTESGNIEVKSFHQYQHKVQRFEGHTDKVFSLQLSPDNKCFLSISLDRTAKLWRFVEDLDPQSPKLKQTFWKNLHSPEENIEPHRTFKVQDDYITSAAFPYDNSLEIVTGSKNGKITRWCMKTATVMRECALGLPITHISYIHDSQRIIFAYDGKVYIYSRASLDYTGQFGIFEEITKLVLIPLYTVFKEVAVIGGKKFEIWDYEYRKKRFSFEGESKITTAVLSGDFLVLGTESYIYLYNYKLQKVLHFKNDYRKPSSLFLLPDRIAFITLDKESVQRCELCLEPNEKPLVHDLALFGCHWKESVPIYFIVNSENKIDIFHGHSNILTETEISDKIKCATFSLCGNYLILGTENGKVYFYNYKKKDVKELPICDKEINLIKCFEFGSDEESRSDSCHLIGLVVAVSDKHVVIISDNKVLNELNASAKISNVLYLRAQLIIVDIEGKLAIARFLDDQYFWTPDRYKNVLVAATHKEKNLLGVGCKEADHYVIKVNDKISAQPGFEAKIDSKPKCLSFSSTGKLLSVGCENGDIKIFNLENTLQDVMALHKRSVQRLLFAPNFEPILVSLGDQIAWWNLNNFQEKKDETADRSPDVEAATRQLLVFNFDPWENKKLHDTVPYLLTSTNLNGKQLQYVSASKDFRSFVVIDVDGNIFKMDIINS